MAREGGHAGEVRGAGRWGEVVPFSGGGGRVIVLRWLFAYVEGHQVRVCAVWFLELISYGRV